MSSGIGDAMDGEARDLWSRGLERIGTAVNRQSFETWFKPTRALCMAGNDLTVEAPNRFIADWLREHYAALIEESLRQVGGREISVSFSVPNVQNTTLPDAPPVPPAPPMSNVAGASAAGQLAAEPPPSPLGRASGAPFPAGVLPRARRDQAGLGETRLDPRYTFANFVVGSGNRFAHAASTAVAEAPGQTYNPLFLYGGVGLGKTHLLQAIGNAITASGSSQRVYCVSAETFMNEMIYAIQHGKTFEFRNRYRGVDVLLIDDIQFLAGKESTQEEFFHTFNSLYSSGKQIVLTSDRPPREIPTLEERLVSRFQWGLITDIQIPDLETRVAILRHKAEQEGIDLANEVLLLIARSARSNIRELEGSLVRLMAYSSLTGKEVTPELASEVLKDLLAPSGRQLTVEDVQKAVSRYYRLPLEAMRARKRTSAVAMPRQIAMYLSRELTSLSLGDIGERFGGRDHTTVLHACDKVSRAVKEDRELKGAVERIVSSLEGAPSLS